MLDDLGCRPFQSQASLLSSERSGFSRYVTSRALAAIHRARGCDPCGVHVGPSLTLVVYTLPDVGIKSNEDHVHAKQQ